MSEFGKLSVSEGLLHSFEKIPIEGSINLN